MLFLHPRFWGEEGKFYYFDLQGQPFLSPFFLVIRGNFQLVTNWIAYCATLVPARFAAPVTTGLSLLALGLFAGLVGLLSVQRKWPLPLVMVLIVSLALLPQGYELYLTATNVQWIGSACVLVLLLLTALGWSRAQALLAYLLVLLAGLTGVCAVLLAPAFLLRKVFQPSAFHFRCGLILGACALLHAAVIAGTVHPGRFLPTDLYTLTFPMVLQSVWSPLIGAGTVNTQLAWILFGVWPRLGTALIYLAALALVGFTVLTAREAVQDRPLPWLVAGSWVSVSVLNVMGSIGDPRWFVSGWGGGRYFFLGSVCFLLLLALAASSRDTMKSTLAIGLLVLTMAAGIRTVVDGQWIEGFIRGESWQANVDSCAGRRPCQVTGWPGGPDWTFELQQR